MNTRIKLTLKLTALLALSLSLCSQAFADRRTALMGNMLLTDRDDSFIYPQEMLKYNNSLSIDYGPSSNSGNALLIAGPTKVMAIGVALGRGDIMNPALAGGTELAALGNAGSLSTSLVGNSYRTPKNVADLLFAMKSGPGRLGVRLGIVGAKAYVEPGAKDADSSGQGQLGFRFSAGYTMPKLGNFVLDIVSDTSENITNEKATQRATGTQVHLGARAYPVRKDAFKIGVLADINYLAGADTDLTDKDDKAKEFSSFGIMLGGGPVYTSKNKKLKVAFQGILGYTSETAVPDNSGKNNITTTSDTMFPGFNVSMEYMIRDWLAFRSGAMNYYHFETVTSETAADDDVTSNHGEEAGFGWSAGLGFIMENMRIDATFSNDFLTAGPYFISGVNRNAPMFTLLSATGKF